MLALKRLMLVIFVLAAPPILTALLYYGTFALLAATNRVIDPQIVQYAAVGEFVVFFFVAILEARSRWSAQ
jgi:hypothetical protein